MLKIHNWNSSKRWKFIIVVLSICLIGCSGALKASQEPQAQEEAQSLGQNLPISARAIIGNQVIELEVAKTEAEQAIGLMYRESLPDNRGMLFPFNPPRRGVAFWMKNVLINLDMIFLRDGEIKAIATNVPPCKQSPCPIYGPGAIKIDQVIELRGGRAIELGLKVGDRILVEFLEPVNSYSNH